MGKAFSTATHVHNKTPTRALDGLTLREVLYSTKPNVANLRAFSAPCAIVESTEQLKKLDDRARMCFLVGINTVVVATGFGTRKRKLSLSPEMWCSLRKACCRPHSTPHRRPATMMTKLPSSSLWSPHMSQRLPT